jgi:hypothetical protein
VLILAACGLSTIYGVIDRQNLPGFFRTFDFASPDAHTPRRPLTTVPQQALYLMNSPFAIEQATCLANRPEVQRADADDRRIAVLFRCALGRDPAGDESAAALAYLKSAADVRGPQPEPLPPWVRLAQVLLMTNEFAYVD